MQDNQRFESDFVVQFQILLVQNHQHLDHYLMLARFLQFHLVLRLNLNQLGQFGMFLYQMDLEL